MTNSNSKTGDPAAEVGTAEEDNSRSSDHEYFAALEELFIGLRGAPLLLSPSDWKTASKWRRDGIPLDIVSRVLREVFERRQGTRGLGGVRSLRYFDPAVQSAWKEVRELGAVDGHGRPAPLDIPSRLRALEAALPPGLVGVASIRREMVALEGAADQIERSLMKLDGDLVHSAESALDESTRADVEREVDMALQRLSTRIDGNSLEETRQHLRSRILRRRFDLPVLSLFSPDAAPRVVDDDDESIG